MKFCTFFSESHKRLFDESFIPSFPFENGLDLIIRKIEQECPTGNLFDVGWVNSMTAKEVFINEVLERYSNEIIVFSDVDIMFYGPIKQDLEDLLGDYDILFQKDHHNNPNGRCAGFFVAKSNEKVKKLFSNVLERIRESSKERKDKRADFIHSEQNAVNREVEALEGLNWDFLPERYYTHGLYEQGINDPENASGFWWQNKTPEEIQNVYVPIELKMHHANWCIGIERKLHLLNFVKSKHDWKLEKTKNKQRVRT